MKKLAAAIGIFLLSSFFAVTVYAWQRGECWTGPGMMGGWGMGWFGMIFMMIFWILLIVGMVFLIKWLIQSTRHDKAGGSGNGRAFEILKERYAHGEIDKDEFESKKKDLLG
jgi:putative membrane protein